MPENASRPEYQHHSDDVEAETDRGDQRLDRDAVLDRLLGDPIEDV